MDGNVLVDATELARRLGKPRAPSIAYTSAA